MEKHPIENILSATMENLKSMIDVNTVIGQAVVSPGGATVIPVSCVGFGFVSGGGEYGGGDEKAKSEEQNVFPFAGGSGAGVSVKPNGFLVLQNSTVKFLPIQQNSTYDRIIELVPELVREIRDILKNGDGEETEEAHSYMEE